MEKALLSSNLLRFSFVKQIQPVFFQVTGKRRFACKMSTAKEFPPEKVRAIVFEVASLLKERKESVSVAETVSLLFISRCFSFPSTSPTLCILLSSARKVGMLSPREGHSIPWVRWKEMEWREDESPGYVANKTQAAGGIISASLLSTPGASGFYKGGLTVSAPRSLPLLSLYLSSCPSPKLTRLFPALHTRIPRSFRYNPHLSPRFLKFHADDCKLAGPMRTLRFIRVLQLKLWLAWRQTSERSWGARIRSARAEQRGRRVGICRTEPRELLLFSFCCVLALLDEADTK
jgi:hypothetical protein